MFKLFDFMRWLKSWGIPLNSLDDVWDEMMAVYEAEATEDKVVAVVKLAQRLKAVIPGTTDDRLLEALAGLVDADEMREFIREVEAALGGNPRMLGAGEEDPRATAALVVAEFVKPE